MSFHRPLLLACAAALLGACAAKTEKQLLDVKKANSRALEQRRMNLISQYSDEGITARGAEVAIYDPEKTFDPRAARFGRAAMMGSKSAQTNEFNFVDRVRTKDFATREHITKTAWTGDLKFETKAAPVRDSWLSRLTARTKTFDTSQSKSQFSDKSATTRALPGSDKPFLVKGRRQADYDRNGAGAQAMGGDRMDGQSWTGDLRPLTIEDVKKLLNKN